MQLIHSRWKMVIVSCFFSTIGFAQDRTPVFSLEVNAINAVAVTQPQGQTIIVAPGDILTVHIYMQDWSPNNQRMRAYQAQLTEKSFTSGDAGTIQPVGYAVYRAESKDNSENAFIDIDHPLYSHLNLACIQLTDTRNAPGYRWLSVVIDPSKAPACPQNGTKFYGGTVKMIVSNDAQGTFTVSYVKNQDATGMMDENNDPILPTTHESLTIEVREEIARLRIVSSDPPSGSIDARQPSAQRNPTNNTWDSVTLTIHSDNKNINKNDFVITDGSNNPPQIRNLKKNDSSVCLHFDRTIRPGAWTQIEYKTTRQRIIIASLPGDVNSDGIRDIYDIAAMEDALNGVITLPDHQSDIDCSGHLDSNDMNNLIQLLSPLWYGKIPTTLK